MASVGVHHALKTSAVVATNEAGLRLSMPCHFVSDMSITLKALCRLFPALHFAPNKL